MILTNFDLRKKHLNKPITTLISFLLSLILLPINKKPRHYIFTGLGFIYDLARNEDFRNLNILGIPTIFGRTSIAKMQFVLVNSHFYGAESTFLCDAQVRSTCLINLLGAVGFQLLSAVASIRECCNIYINYHVYNIRYYLRLILRR